MNDMEYSILSQSTNSLSGFVDYLNTHHPRLQPALDEVAASLPADTRIVSVSYSYSSLDEQGAPVRLSALMLLRLRGDSLWADRLWLENRATQAADADVPSHSLNIGAAHVLRHGVLVSPDLMSFGASVDKPICYCHGALTARHTVDAVVAAQQLLREVFGYEGDPLPVLSSGHSQGAFSALAVHRYWETQATDEERRWLPLQRTWCADGPYLADVMTRYCCAQKRYLYGAYMVMNAMSYLQYHPECFEPGVTIRDFLTDEARELGVVETIAAKQTGSKELVKLTIGALGMRPERIFREDVLREDGRLYEMMMRASRTERLCDGWTPTLPISFFHVEADECVTVEAMQGVQQQWGELDNVTFVTDRTLIEDIPNGLAHAYSGGVFHRQLLRAF